MDIFTILKTQEINPDSIRKFDYAEENGNLILVAQLKGTHRTCPYCGSTNTIIKEYKAKNIKGLNVGSKQTLINLRIPRYKCKDCTKTFTYDVSGFIANSITKDELQELLSAFASMQTFSDIAKNTTLA